jgi:hypothetical protein
MADEIEVVISSNIFFFTIPSRKLLKLLRELGLDFEEEVTWCG